MLRCGHVFIRLNEKANEKNYNSDMMVGLFFQFLFNFDIKVWLF